MCPPRARREVQPREPNFEKCSHLREKGGGTGTVVILRILTGFPVSAGTVSTGTRDTDIVSTGTRGTSSYSSTGEHSPSKMWVFYHQILQTSRLSWRASRMSKSRPKPQRHSQIARFGAPVLKIKSLGYTDPCRKLTIVF